MYMILYYDSRIREAVAKRWAEDRVPSMESNVVVNIPESEIDPHDSHLMKDPKIPISYKFSIAQKLYDAETEVIKAHVRSRRETWRDGATTVHTDDEAERLDLVRSYQKSVHGLTQCYPCLI